MATVIMALVNPQGQVVNKIVVDTEKPFTPPQGWSMHEWDERTDGPAYEKYLKNPGIPFSGATPVGVTPSNLQVMALVDPQGQVVNKIVMDTEKPFVPPKGWSMHEWTEADEEAYARYLASRRGQ